MMEWLIKGLIKLIKDQSQDFFSESLEWTEESPVLQNFWVRKAGLWNLQFGHFPEEERTSTFQLGETNKDGFPS